MNGIEGGFVLIEFLPTDVEVMIAHFGPRSIAALEALRYSC